MLSKHTPSTYWGPRSSLSHCFLLHKTGQPTAHLPTEDMECRLTACNPAVCLLSALTPPETQERRAHPSKGLHSAPGGCLGAATSSIRYRTLRTILPYKCKRRYLNPSRRRMASFFPASSSAYKTGLYILSYDSAPKYSHRKPLIFNNFFHDQEREPSPPLYSAH